MAKINATTIIRPEDKDFDERHSERIRRRDAIIAASLSRIYNLTSIRKRLEDSLKKLPAKLEN